MTVLARCACCVVVAVLLAVTQSAQADDVAWQTQLDEALASAAQQRQPVLVFATMRGCRSCKVMHRESYKNDTVTKQLNRDFIPVWLDANQAGAALNRLGVQYYPTTLILSPQGKVIDKIEGYGSTSALERSMKDALERRVASAK